MPERIITPSRLVKGALELLAHTPNMFTYPARGRIGEADISACRDYFLSYLHYRYEVTAYTQSGVLVTQDLVKHGYAQAEIRQDILRELIEKHLDYMIMIFFFDDLEDNCPMRGDMKPYHLVNKNADVAKMYKQTRSELLALIHRLEPTKIPKLVALMSLFDGELEQEGSDNYYDLNQLSTSVEGFVRNAKKSAAFSSLVTMPFEMAAGAERPEDWQKALTQGCGVAWLVNDLYKNSTQQGLGYWLDVKSGRIPLPVSVAYQMATPDVKEALIDSISQVWETYRPHFDQPEIDVAALNEVDKSPGSRASIQRFSDIMASSPVKQIFDRNIRDRVAYVSSVSERHGGLAHLDFFLMSLGGYIGEKTLRGMMMREPLRPNIAEYIWV